MLEEGSKCSHNVNPLRVQVCLQSAVDGRKPSVLEQVCEREGGVSTPILTDM